MKTHLLTFLLLLGGVCTVNQAKAQFAAGIDRHQAAPHKIEADSMPERWTMAPEYAQTSPSDDKWWQTFGDPMLTSLIAKGEANNYNVVMAWRRIETARRQLDITRAGYFPTVAAYADYGRTRQAGALEGRHVPSTNGNAFSLGLRMNWEIDLFGRIAAQAKSDKANIAASRADYTGAMVSMAASIAKLYFQLRTSQQLKATLEEHVASQQKIVDITKARYEAGLSSALDVSQALTVLYSTESSIPGVDADISTAINSLAVLVGEYPRDLQPLLQAAAPLPECRQGVFIGTPAEILRRRPDIVAAECQLAGYAAQVGIAKKEFLPTLTLSGSIGTETKDADALFKSNSLAYSIEPTLSWTIFDGLARNYQVALAKEEMMASVDNYNLTVMTAIEEVNNALASYSSALQQEGKLEKVVEESRKSLNYSLDLYKKGLSPFTDVMNAQLTWLTNQSSLISARGSALAQLATLYQALGGSDQ